jgi:casein kinase I homolog HRR25
MAKLNVRTMQISCIESVHSRHYIHGDVKPANFLMGLGAHDNEVYIIDFGLARMYRDRKTHLHIPYKENCYPIGTAPFASINNHLGVERSRRDDMESLAYILIYFLRGSLPWSGIKLAMDMQQHEATLQQKMGSPVDLLGSAYPNEFSVFLSYTRTLHFDEKPDYAYMRKIFRELLLRTEYQHPSTRDSPDAPRCRC